MEDGALAAELALTETESCKPNMLMATLSAFAGVEVPRAQVIRLALLGENGEGERVPLEEL